MLEALSKKLNLVCLIALGLNFALALNASRSIWFALNFVYLLPLVAALCAYTVRPRSWVAYLAMALNALAASSVAVFAWGKFQGSSHAGVYSAWFLLGLLFLPAVVNVAAMVRRVQSPAAPA